MKNVTENFLISTYINSTQETLPVCLPPAYLEFPPDAFTNHQRLYGAVVIHILVVIYIFYALAVVCDDYFVTSLDHICEKLGFSEDVAGATFMAVGSSAPELFTAIIGVFITQGDVGVGTIVGSAVFNILFVIGICGLLCDRIIALSWYSVCRDSLFYSLSVICLIFVMFDGVITWYESLIMLIMYVVYILIMRFNVQIRSVVTNRIKWKLGALEMMEVNGALKQDFDRKRFQGDYEIFENDDDDVFSPTVPPRPPPPVAKTLTPSRNLSRIDEDVASSPMKLTMEEACFRYMMRRRFNSRTRFEAAVRLVISYRRRVLSDLAAMKRQHFKSAGPRLSTLSYTKCPRNWFSMTFESTDNFDLWRTVPQVGDGYVYMCKWALTYPIRIAFYYTIPDCRKKRWENWFLATFSISIIWVALLSYIMVWMVTLIGYTWSIPDSVMGITFLAAGTSIPDAMASVFVSKQGMGDMAVSNSIGSNVFDILIGLAVPWFMKTALVKPGTYVQINSNGMVYSILLLFFTIVIAVGSIHMSGWVLSRRVGVGCLLVYVVYLIFSIMIECNVFGHVNPPMCNVL